VAGVLGYVATLANYAERVTAELAMCVPSEKLARHSSARGINLSMPRAAYRRNTRGGAVNSASRAVPGVTRP
jgi:hypothetical protein